MKKILTLLVLLGSLVLVFAQGSLTPPGAPAPVMKTLDQVEPRIPISSLPYTITSAGAYYLTTNLTGASGTNGITIAANDVTLDLNGFSLAGVPGSNDGILVSGNRTNLCIANGTVRSWDFDNVDALNTQSSRFLDLTIIGSGNTGLRSGATAVITHCTAFGNSQEGILAFDGCQVSQCAVRNNGAAGIAAGNNCRIADCQAQFNNFDGISAGSSSSISGCTAANNTAHGIEVGSSCIISGCTTQANTNSGISTGSSCTIDHCTASNDFPVGIVAGPGSTVSGCSVQGVAGTGIFMSFGGNVSACAASFNAIGIAASSSSHVKNNNCSSNSSSGISVQGNSSRVEENNVTANSIGIDALLFSDTNNLIIRNSARANAVNYSIVAGNKVGVIVSPPSSAAISGSAGGTGVGTTDPWANFSN
jgi:parallel beta-helix repeat protein